MTDRTCQWPDCSASLGRANKWCPTHRKAKAAEYARNYTATQTCTEAECFLLVKARGLCGMHYRRWERANGMATPPSGEWNPRRKANWKKRHALKRGATHAEIIYDNWVYDRDQWTGQLCGRPIDRTLAWPNNMCASVDHRIPVSRGGTHTRDNVQAAHFVCNARKGAKQAQSSLTR